MEKLLQLNFDIGNEWIGKIKNKKLHDIIIEWMLYHPKLSGFWRGTSMATDKELIDFRIVDSNFHAQSYLVQLDTGLEVDDELRKSDNWIKFNHEVGAHACLINEIYSLGKEAKDHQIRSNYVFVKMNNNNITAQQSMDEIVFEANQTFTRVLIYGQNLKELNVNGMTEYVDGLIGICEGNLFWSTICDRYKNF